ncbi:DUF58 domain-containing protein [Aquibacillus halophilus]|uniref:DUF58 domain-containing protein n=1 Tax=Aquibacillus halophilus TaxID=930132 RepID=A0A6A8DK89_9BACI|nr:DUF58 domain-containing protein [Aquibacillus halophilus]MRH44896.1 DUF58 domain-containing protein [Aquibacillus halophilus]
MKENLSFIIKLMQILLIFVVFFTYAMFQGGFVSWFLFYSFLPLLVYLFLLLIHPISKWSVKRTLSQNVARAGDAITVNVEIKRRWPFPIHYCIIEEFFPLSLQQKSINLQNYRYFDQPEIINEKRLLEKAVFPWFKKTIHFQYTLENLPRGEHQLNAIRIKTGDFFGFIKRDYVASVTNRLLVYPHRRELMVRERVSSFDEGTSPSQNITMKNANVVTGVREYMPGDRFSWIDWKTTARKNTVMTKEFEQEKSSGTTLILDAVDYDGLNKLVYEASVEVTFSLIEFFKKKTSQLGFLTLGKEPVFFPFHEDSRKKDLIDRFLAKVEPSEGVAFHQQLAEEIKKVPQGLTTMIVITYINPEIKQSIDIVKRKSKRVVVYLIQPLSKITNEDNQIINQLTIEGVIVNLLTEKVLISQRFEVNM